MYDKAFLTGLTLGLGLVGYKVAIYAVIAHKAKQAKQQKVVNITEIAELKNKLDKEKED